MLFLLTTLVFSKELNAIRHFICTTTEFYKTNEKMVYIYFETSLGCTSLIRMTTEQVDMEGGWF